MPNIQLKRSLTTGSLPTTASLLEGEIAMNVPDGRIFLRKSGSGSDTIESVITTGARNSGSVQLTGSMSVSGSGDVLTAQGDNIFFTGNLMEFSGDAFEMTGSLAVVGNTVMTGSLAVTQGITGTLIGTSSWAVSSSQAVSSSFATTASFTNIAGLGGFVQGGNSFGATALLGTNDNQSLSIETSGSVRMFVSSSGNVGVGTLTPAYTLDVSGSMGVTGNIAVRPFSSTVNFANGQYIQDNGGGGLRVVVPNFSLDLQSGTDSASAIRMYTSGSVERMRINTVGNIGIGTTAPNARLDVNGSTNINGNTVITGSIAITQNITGSRAFLSGSTNTASGSILTVVGSGSTQPVFTVQGSQGELFSVTDSLTGSLFSVNDISGLPILEVFSDNTTLIGNYLDPMLITTAKTVLTDSGSFTVYSIPTSSFDAAFFEYSVRSGSNARAGQIMAIQSGSAVNYTETTTTSFGSTTGISLGVFISGSNMVLTGSATTPSWTVKTIVRSI